MKRYDNEIESPFAIVLAVLVPLFALVMLILAIVFNEAGFWAVFAILTLAIFPAFFVIIKDRKYFAVTEDGILTKYRLKKTLIPFSDIKAAYIMAGYIANTKRNYYQEEEITLDGKALCFQKPIICLFKGEIKSDDLFRDMYTDDVSALYADFQPEIFPLDKELLTAIAKQTDALYLAEDSAELLKMVYGEKPDVLDGIDITYITRRVSYYEFLRLVESGNLMTITYDGITYEFCKDLRRDWKGQALSDDTTVYSVLPSNGDYKQFDSLADCIESIEPFKEGGLEQKWQEGLITL